ncbi:hypothetical protein CHU98_g10135 [Xylaria longipes]|nr:hypothetical protein CHU98_g10135 [Xylaria longipes]
MCQFWATTYPCGHFTRRNSGYKLCARRGEEGCTISLQRYQWKTFCPLARKSLKGRRYTPGTRLPACCEKLDCERLCHKCDSITLEGSICPGHLELVSEEIVDLETASAVFEKAVCLWPSDHRGRYLRRKGDKTSTLIFNTCVASRSNISSLTFFGSRDSKTSVFNRHATVAFVPEYLRIML